MEMKARINTYAFRQDSIESASIGVLGVVAHPIAHEGRYLGTVVQENIRVGAFVLAVASDVSAQQADVDLSWFEAIRRQPRDGQAERSFAIRPKGYLVLYTSEGQGAFRVTLDKAEGEKAKREFDTQTLQDGDMFIANLIRPGSYEVTETYTKAFGRIQVLYPEVGKEKLVVPTPAMVRVTAKGLSASDVTVQPTQGVVFTIEGTKASLIVKLVEANAGGRKPGKDRDRLRWRNPRHPPLASRKS